MSVQEASAERLDQYDTEINGEFARGFAVRRDTMTEWFESTLVCHLEDWR